MTKKEALAGWRGFYLPLVRCTYEKDGVPDRSARAESWGAYTDALCKDGQITLRQYESWSCPPECGR